VTDSLSQVADGYEEFLRDLKERIRDAQVRAALAVNRDWSPSTGMSVVTY
jgi:hypothetical protein